MAGAAAAGDTPMIFRMRLVLVAAGLAAAALGFHQLAAKDEPAAKLSPRDPKAWEGVVSAADLAQLVATEHATLKEEVGSRSRFRRSAKRAVLTGRLLAVLGNIGTVMLEGDDALKAAALRQAGVDLVAAAEKGDVEPAEKAAKVIGTYPATIAPGAKKDVTDFEELISTHDSMLLTNSMLLKLEDASKLEGAALDKEVPAAVAQAKLLGAWAVVWAGDDAWNGGDSWDEYCVEMRNASVEMARAFQAKDTKAAKAAWQRVGNTCTGCHKDNGIVVDE